MENKFRPDVYILDRFIDAFYENRMMKKTHLQYLSRINWNSFIRYMEWLETNHYIDCKIIDKSEMYQLTENGRCMFDIIMKLRNYIIYGR